MPEGRGTRAASLVVEYVVWFIATGEKVPRLVTSYPLKRARR